MTTEQQRIKLAEWDGWALDKAGGWNNWGHPEKRGQIPNYLSDLNAVHDLKRKALTNRELCDRFNKILYTEELPGRPVEFEIYKWTWGQPADVQCRALLKTLGLWEE